MSAEKSVSGIAGSLRGKTGPESLDARNESPAELSMNALTAAEANAARARAQAMFHRVLTGWASDVLRLERERRLGRHRPGSLAQGYRAAA